ncbi:hypothetical protein U1708_05965 [Sphingomonas sp. ZB1N12]|uniref:hypothetical protein n=1 Tax=Sphingomonas arabinosi TaxID=3096160 RepID=UPI002FC657FB
MAGTPTVFIQIWVDINAVQNGSTTGVYMVDNRVANGSQNEGSAGLSTQVTNGSTIQWNIYNIDANSAAVLSIADIGNCNVWGAGGQPETVGGGVFVGQAQVTGGTNYAININVQKQVGSAGITINLNPSITAK